MSANKVSTSTTAAAADKPSMMKAPGRLPKPELGAGSGEIVSRTFLPHDLQCDLQRLVVDGGALEGEAAKFIEACNKLAQMVCGGSRKQSFAEERSQLNELSGKARDLLLAVRRLSSDARSNLEAQADHSLHSPNAPVQWSKFAVSSVGKMWPEHNLLSCAWDIVEALEHTARYTANELPRNRRIRAKEMSGYGLTKFIVNAYVGRFGKLPPADQNGWFVEFMRLIGVRLSLSCGPRLVRKAINEARLTLSDQLSNTP